MTTTHDEPKVNKHEVCGIVTEQSDDQITLSIPHTDYQFQLTMSSDSGSAEIGEKVFGRIEAKAGGRIDVCQAGGNFIDPVYGRPRIMQGRVLSVSAGSDRLVIRAGVILHLTVKPPQRADQFEPGSTVRCAIERGAWFVTGK